MAESRLAVAPWLAASAALSGLAACGDVGANNTVAIAEAKACTPPRSHWMRPVPLDAGLSPPINRISLDSQGMIYWNGQATTFPRLSHYLDIVAAMNPRPHTFLETEMGAPCALLDRIRDEMDRRLQCRTQGSCAEGIWTVWEHTPLPPGTPPS